VSDTTDRASNGAGKTDPHVQFDQAYEIDSDIPPRELWEHDRDSVFYFDTVVRCVIETALNGARGRVLDVGSGDGHQLLALLRAGRDGVDLYGLDLSRPMVEKSVRAFVSEPKPPRIVQGSAERLPFADGTFDRIVCQGSLDHFGDASGFMAECARVLAPGGRLIIALQNFDSASCRISRWLYRLRGFLRVSRADPTGAARPYWQIPDNHTFKGNAAVLRRLGRRHLRLDRMYGVSMFWLLPMWRRALRIAPAPVANAMLRAGDAVARRVPSAADMLISVWVRRDA
jgi:SAM-dependent methyltransferase